MRISSDPVEAMVGRALLSAGYEYETDKIACNGREIDFYVPELSLYIECKAYSSDRTNNQIADINNLILVQGLMAATAFSELLKGPRQ